jgi:hypothetical protein
LDVNGQFMMDRALPTVGLVTALGYRSLKR